MNSGFNNVNNSNKHQSDSQYNIYKIFTITLNASIDI